MIQLLVVFMLMFGLFQNDTQIYTSNDGTTSLTYPSDWTIQDDGFFITVTNNAEALTADGVTPGTAAVIIFNPTTTSLVTEPNVELQDLPEIYLGTLAADAEVRMSPDGVRVVTFDDRQAVQLDFVADDFEGTVIAFDAGQNEFFAMYLVAYQGEFVTFAETLFEIATSVEYTPLTVDTSGLPEAGEALALEATFETGTFQFNYPDTWVFEEQNGYYVLDSFDVTVAGDGTYLPNATQVLVFLPELLEPLEIEGDTPSAFLDDFLANNAQVEAAEETTALTINEREAAQTRLISDDGAALYIVLEVEDDTFVMIFAAAANAESLTLFEPTISAIAESFVWGE